MNEKKYPAVNLDGLYAKAKCLKDEVYHRWIENLERFTLSGDPAMQKEALRCIGYIERNLLSAEAA